MTPIWKTAAVDEFELDSDRELCPSDFYMVSSAYGEWKNWEWNLNRGLAGPRTTAQKQARSEPGLWQANEREILPMFQKKQMLVSST